MGKLRFRGGQTSSSLQLPPAIEAAVKKKAGGARPWMRMDRWGQSELIECDKSVIIKRVSLPARDLRILGPVFSHSSCILAREKAMIINLEFIRAIVTAEEVLLLDPLRHEVLPFVDQLRQQLLQRIPSKRVADHAISRDDEMQSPTAGQWLPLPEAAEDLQDELPFEFQVLEITLEVVCAYLDTSVGELERDAYPALDELAMEVSTKNLEHVRSLKSSLSRLLARVQKVRDEVEHLLDDNEHMAHLCLTQKWIQNQKAEAPSTCPASYSIVPAAAHPCWPSSTRCGSSMSNCLNERDVVDLEMLLEAYFVQLDGTRNKIISVRKYIEDTEDHVNIKLDSQRNELIQLQLTMAIASFAIGVENLAGQLFGVNLPFRLANMTHVFGPVVGIMTAVSVVIFLLVFGYARWKKLLGS